MHLDAHGVVVQNSLKWLNELRFILGYILFVFFLMDSPYKLTRCALCTSRSRMASATVDSPKSSYQLSTGSCDVMTSQKNSVNSPSSYTQMGVGHFHRKGWVSLSEGCTRNGHINKTICVKISGNHSGRTISCIVTYRQGKV